MTRSSTTKEPETSTPLTLTLLVFGGVFSKGRRAAIAATNSIGGRVLEVGVGTGISLPQYAPHLRIFGTDISEAMLRKAKARVADLRQHGHGLHWRDRGRDRGGGQAGRR